MKIKKKLILSYIIVMLIPIITAVLLYKWIENYNSKIEISDYVNTIKKFSKYEKILDNPELYLHETSDINIVNEKEKNKVQIKLYNKYGTMFYSTRNCDYNYYMTNEAIYKNLYEIIRGYRVDTIKKPVFEDKNIVGFYEISVARDRWIKGVNYRTQSAVILFIIISLLLLIVAIRFIDKKFNKPIKKLIYSINMFAKGENEEIKYKTRDEIGELIYHFNIMKKDIEKNKKEILKQQKLKEYMIAAISHDLKTPLTSIRAYAEAVNSENNMSQMSVKKYTSVILNKCDYMKNMLDDLLTYTILTSDYKMNFTNVDGEEFFDMLFSGYDELCQKNNINLNVDIKTDGMYKVDVNQMIRVADNLINNAIRYTPQNGDIHLGAFSDNHNLSSWISNDFKKDIDVFRKKGVVLVVKNSGQSIKKSEYEKIFSPFYQSDASRCKVKEKGTGIGLSTVKLIIEKHEGKVKVLSKENYGTVMMCYLKRSDVN